MKSILILAVIASSSFAYASATQPAVLHIGATAVSSTDYQALVDLDVDMYSFENTSDTDLCYEGDVEQVSAIAKAILDIGTGDSVVTDVTTTVQDGVLNLDFAWYGEDGDHETERSIAPCK